jgi:hypothetical protein
MDANIKHNSEYEKLFLHEDFLAICNNDPCQALLLSVLEEKAKEVGLEFIPLSYTDFRKAIHAIYGRSSIINSLKDLEQKGMILAQPYPDPDICAYEYRLNFTHLQNLLDNLPVKVISRKYRRSLSPIPTSYNDLTGSALTAKSMRPQPGITLFQEQRAENPYSTILCLLVSLAIAQRAAKTC